MLEQTFDERSHQHVMDCPLHFGDAGEVRAQLLLIPHERGALAAADDGAVCRRPPGRRMPAKEEVGEVRATPTAMPPFGCWLSSV